MNTNSNVDLLAAMALSFDPGQVQRNMVLRAPTDVAPTTMNPSGWSNHSQKRGANVLAKRRRKSKQAKISRRKNR